MIKQTGAQNVGLLFVPANDWLGVKDIHAGMAAFRAVENGMSVFRQTGSGVSSVIDAYGRTIHRLDAFEEDSTGNFASIQMVTTPVGSVNTIYLGIGDAVANIMLVLFVGLIAGLWLSRKQAAKHANVASVPV